MKNMEARYPGVVTRLLSAAERAISTSEPSTPLVIEAQHHRDPASLHALLRSRSGELISDAAKHGAVLLRGFSLRSDRDFEEAVLSIPGMVGIDRVFMAEEGRTLVDGQRFVLHTNSIYTTGGSVELGGFHSENYFVPDVPRFIFFFCRKPSWLGGETGLVNTAGLYDDLSAEQRRKLEHASLLATQYALADIAARYGMSLAAARSFCESVGLEVTESDHDAVVSLYKPSVFVHPLTGERAININYWSGLLSLGFRGAIQRAFLPDFAGPRWAAHTLLWRIPALSYFIPTLTVLKAPLIAARNLRETLSNRLRSRIGRSDETTGPSSPRVDSAFEPGDELAIAAAMRRRFSSFRWESGDLLMVDNLKMAHAGMPGFGPRLLRAMICNPLPVPLSAGTSGTWSVPDSGEVAETIGTKAESLRAQGPLSQT